MTTYIQRGNDKQWIESRGGREVTVTTHPIRSERVEFLNEPDDPSNGPLTLKFYLGSGHVVGKHTHPKQTETITVNRGSIRATIDGETRILVEGDHERIPPGVPHGYAVVGEEETILAVSITPALQFKEFVVAEHALSAEAYSENGLNLPYSAIVARRYGPMIAPPMSGMLLTFLIGILSAIGRLRRLQIPDEPLRIHNGNDR